MNVLFWLAGCVFSSLSRPAILERGLIDWEGRRITICYCRFFFSRRLDSCWVCIPAGTIQLFWRLDLMFPYRFHQICVCFSFWAWSNCDWESAWFWFDLLLIIHLIERKLGKSERRNNRSKATSSSWLIYGYVPPLCGVDIALLRFVNELCFSS